MIMKHTKNRVLSLLLFASVVAGVCSSCENDIENYDNKAFINSSKVGTILLLGLSDSEQAVIQTSIAKKEASNVTVTYRADSLLVGQYNMTYNEKASALPGRYYDIPQKTSTIVAGTVKGSDVEIHFKDLLTIDRDSVYVLPVTVSESSIDVLNSARTIYFVIKGGAMINMVADIAENSLALQSPGQSSLKGMKQLTVEALVRVNKFDKLISTLMGIENEFLIRIGDSGVPDNQIQLATSNGNLTDPKWQIPANEWVHIAFTFDSTDGTVKVYINGEKKGETQTTAYRSDVNWNTTNFYVGKSYDNERWLDGAICECRVWSRVLKAEEIGAPNHYYLVAPNSDGLDAYWKFDEGSGQLVKDHTGNGNHLVSSKAIAWKSVSLPK